MSADQPGFGGWEAGNSGMWKQGKAQALSKNCS
jgi:hypothetical protein